MLTRTSPRRFRHSLVRIGPPMVLLVCYVLLGRPVAAGSDSEEVPKLEVVARYEIPDLGDPITDVQWAGKESIYLGLFERGIIEVKLREGLPEVKHLLGTQREGHPGLNGIVRFAVSDEWVVGMHNRFAWARRSSGGGPAVPMVQRNIAGPFDFALDRDIVVLWGRPDKEHWEEAKGGVLWRTRLSKGLDTWDPLYENDEIAANPDLVGENFDARGSVAFHEGEILLAPNAPRVLPTVLRFSFSGKLKESWTPDEIWDDGRGEILDRGLDEEVARRNGPLDEDSFKSFLGNRRIVEAVLSLPEGPAIVVREPGDGGAQWRLALLSPEVRWYEIPTPRVSSTAQFLGDADEEGRIVVVGAIRERTEHARVTENEVMILKLPLQVPAEADPK